MTLEWREQHLSCVGHTAPDHYGLDVDQHRGGCDRSGQRACGPVERGRRYPISEAGCRRKPRSGGRLPGAWSPSFSGRPPNHRRAPSEGFDTAPRTARAERPIEIDDGVPDVTGVARRAGMHPTADHQPAADTG